MRRASKRLAVNRQTHSKERPVAKKRRVFSFRAGRPIVMCIAIRIGLFFCFTGKQSVKSVIFYLLSYVMQRAGLVPSGDAEIQL